MSDAASFEPQPEDQRPTEAVCQRCFGTGIDITSGAQARRCACRKGEPRETLEQIARIPDRFKDCDLASYKALDNDEWKWHAKTAAQELIDNYVQLDGRGLLFRGPVGVGKTHLAVAILRALIQRYGVVGLFCQFGALLKEIQDSYNSISKSSELTVLAPVFEADVLVLDELGAVKPTDWVRDTMMQIINTRYNDKKLTIFTTNYPDDEVVEASLAKLLELKQSWLNSNLPEASAKIAMVEKKFTLLTKVETLEDRIGVRLRSRLYEMCKTVMIEGDDYRRKLESRAGR